jgi:hypothetical protein
VKWTAPPSYVTDARIWDAAVAEVEGLSPAGEKVFAPEFNVVVEDPIVRTGLWYRYHPCPGCDKVYRPPGVDDQTVPPIVFHDPCPSCGTKVVDDRTGRRLTLASGKTKWEWK